MSTNAKLIVGLVVVLLGVVGAIGYSGMHREPGKLDAFASCLKEKGALFYGAFWCPHCQKQKEMFGTSADLLPYVECSPVNGQGQLPICTQAGVEGYPTWKFTDGSKLSGEIPLEALASKTGCELPK